jgi:uncharacterized membrane protein YtjA (UPF0391 family)
MHYYPLVFLIVVLISSARNLAGVSTVGVQISLVLFIIGIVWVAIHLVRGRTSSRPVFSLIRGGL